MILTKAISRHHTVPGARIAGIKHGNYKKQPSNKLDYKLKAQSLDLARLILNIIALQRTDYVI